MNQGKKRKLSSYGCSSLDNFFSVIYETYVAILFASNKINMLQVNICIILLNKRTDLYKTVI